jgi:tRNA_anti-like
MCCTPCRRTWLAFLLLILLGCGKPDARNGTRPYTPRTNFDSAVIPPASAPATPPMNQAKAAFTLSAQQFYDEYTRTPKDAKARFAGKVIELTGTVRAMGTNPTAQPVLYLSVVGDPLGVLCIFYNVETNLSEQVSKGQQIRVRGAWPEHSSVGCLADCVLLGR